MKLKKLVTQGGEMTKKELKRVALEMADALVAVAFVQVTMKTCPGSRRSIWSCGKRSKILLDNRNPVL